MVKASAKRVGTSIGERLATRDEVQRKLDDICLLIPGAMREHEEMKRLALVARSELYTFERDLAVAKCVIELSQSGDVTINFSALLGAANLNEEERKKIAILRDDISTADQMASNAAAKLEQLKTDEKSICVEISALNLSVSIDEVLTFQEKLLEAEEEVFSLQAAIDLQEEVAKKAVEGLPSTVEHAQKRENLLALIAVGNASEADLADVDREIGEADQAFKAAEEKAKGISTTARQTIEGLRRKLAAAEDSLGTLKARKNEVAHRFLVSEAERIGNDYARLAEELTGRFNQLMALDLIIKRRGFPSISGHKTSAFLIPTFRLLAHANLQYQGDGKGEMRMVTAARRGEQLDSDVQAEMERFVVLGVEI